MTFHSQCRQNFNIGLRLFREFVPVIVMQRKSLWTLSTRGSTASFAYGNLGVRESMISLKTCTSEFLLGLINSKEIRSPLGWTLSHVEFVLMLCVDNGCAPSGHLPILGMRHRMNLPLRVKKTPTQQRSCPNYLGSFLAPRLGCSEKLNWLSDRLVKSRVRWAGPPWVGGSGYFGLVSL